MTMQLVKEGKDGQLEFDFESLAALVSQGFADYVFQQVNYLQTEKEKVVLVDFLVREPREKDGIKLQVYRLKLMVRNHCFMFECSFLDDLKGRKEEYRYDWMLLSDCEMFMKKAGWIK